MSHFSFFSGRTTDTRSVRIRTTGYSQIPNKTVAFYDWSQNYDVTMWPLWLTNTSYLLLTLYYPPQCSFDTNFTQHMRHTTIRHLFSCFLQKAACQRSSVSVQQHLPSLNMAQRCTTVQSKMYELVNTSSLAHSICYITISASYIHLTYSTWVASSLCKYHSQRHSNIKFLV
jgi:hypothetical protein